VSAFSLLQETLVFNQRLLYLDERARWIDRWTEPVRPVTAAAAQKMFQRASVTSLGPGTKTPPKHNLQGRRTLHKPKQNNSKTAKNRATTTRPKDTRVKQFTRGKSHKQGTHRLDRSVAPVRPVTPGQLGMNNTCGSTPPNPTPDLPIRSTVSNKTLGIV
jgi:hypothetical protein